MNTRLPLAELRALFRRSPAFRRVFLADVATQLGDGGLLVAFPLLILDRTHDVTLTGLAFSGEILAFGLLSPLAGALADRLEQKQLMIASNLARVAIFALLLGALWAQLPAGAFLALSVLLGAAGAFFMPARAAFVRRLLDGEALDRAIAIEGTAGFLVRLVSPPAMGLLLAVHPPHVGIIADMAAYLLAAVLLVPTWVNGPRLAASEQEPAGAWREGWRTIARSRALAGLLALDSLLCLLGMAAFSITVAFLDQVLHLGAHANGYLLAATGLAGALGAQAARALRRVPGVYLWLSGAIALSYLLVPTTASLPALMAVWAVRGFAIGVFGVLLNQRIVAEVPAVTMGRVQAAWGLAACFAAFAGSAATPLLLRTVGAAQAYLLFGVTLGAVVLLAALALAVAGRFRPRAAAAGEAR